MNFIADSTSTLLDQSRDEEVGDVCEISNRLINGTLAMPGSRELNPSPLQAIHYMHSTLNANVNGAMNFGRIPWPVVAMHAGAHFPTSECMHIASRRNLNTTWLRLNHANATERCGKLYARRQTGTRILFHGSLKTAVTPRCSLICPSVCKHVSGSRRKFPKRGEPFLEVLVLNSMNSRACGVRYHCIGPPTRRLRERR